MVNDMERALTYDRAKDINLPEIISAGGCTILGPVATYMHDDDAATPRYVVGIESLMTCSNAMLRDVVDMLKNVIRSWEMIGLWQDPNTEIWHIDKVQIHADTETGKTCAMNCAKYNNEKAIFDLKTGQMITL